MADGQLPTIIRETLPRDPTEGLLETLFARGFVVERDADRVRLSTSAHGEDREHLVEALRSAGLEEIADLWPTKRGVPPIDTLHQITQKLDPADLAHRCRALLEWRERYGVETLMRETSWQEFAGRIHGYKVAAGHLDSAIAALVKAVNTIGALTITSSRKARSRSMSRSSRRSRSSTTPGPMRRCMTRR